MHISRWVEEGQPVIKLPQSFNTQDDFSSFETSTRPSSIAARPAFWGTLLTQHEDEKEEEQELEEEAIRSALICRGRKKGI